MLKKTFKSYVCAWGICLLLFNLIAFIAPIEKSGGFWAGYVCISLAFLGQLICAGVAFKSENAQKFFYNFPLISISFVGTIATLLFGALTMAISAIPVWVGIGFCAAILCFTSIAIIAASAASGAVSDIDKKIKSETLFIKMLAVDAEVLISKAATDEAKDITKKVYESIRYSDPVSCDSLSHIETQITVCFKEFEAAICENRQNAIDLGDALIVLIKDRNAKCKILK